MAESNAATAVAEQPAAAETPSAAAPETSSEPSVLDVSLFGAQQRSIQYLSYAGLIQGDDKVTALNLLKRINHAAFARPDSADFDDDTGKRIAKWQDGFQRALSTMSMEDLVAKGHVNQLLEGYLQAMADYHRGEVTRLDALPVTKSGEQEPSAFNRKHERAAHLADKYKMELQYWREHPEIVKETISKYPQALEVRKYLPIGQLAIAAGMIPGEKDKVNDMVDDVLANAAAHSLKLMDKPFTGINDEELKNYKDNPKLFATQIKALAERITLAATSLEGTQINADATPELARVQALKNLLSAQLHAAVTWHLPSDNGKTEDQDIAHLADAFVRIRPLIREYQSVAMSLAHDFLGDGAGKDDPRMQKLAGQLETMMEKDKIPLLSAREAQAKADKLAQSTAEDLLQVVGDNPGLNVKLKTMLQQVDPRLADVSLSPREQVIGSSMTAAVGAFLKLGQQLATKLGLNSLLDGKGDKNVTRVLAWVLAGAFTFLSVAAHADAPPADSQYEIDRQKAIDSLNGDMKERCLADFSSKHKQQLVKPVGNLSFNDDLSRAVYQNFYWQESDRGVAFTVPVTAGDALELAGNLACFYAVTGQGLRFQHAQQVFLHFSR